MAISYPVRTTTNTTATCTSSRNHSHHHNNQKQQQEDGQQQLKRRRRKKQPPPLQPLPPPKPSSSWEQFKNLLTCRSTGSQVHNPTITAAAAKYSKLGSSCSDICSFKDVVHGNTRVVHRGDPDGSYYPDYASMNSSSGPLGPETCLLSARPYRTSTSHSRGVQLRKFSGCYECHAITEPTRYPAPPRTICPCPECGEVFTKTESLDLHQTIRHAVSELGPEDSGRNIVEIIFKSSWVKREDQSSHPVFCKIERILKVHNTQRTISRFEGYRDAVKSRASLQLLQATTAISTNSIAGGNRPATKKNPRCAADGNELLRFHCTTLSCSLGARGSTSLCAGGSSSLSPCGVCTIIRHGFGKARQEIGKGVRTTASSGRAHDCCLGAAEDGGKRRAILVCRVIAGRVRRAGDDPSAASPEDDSGGGGGVGYDSVAGRSISGGGKGGGECAYGGGNGNLEELFVANPKAILPCFVVVYQTWK